VVTALGILALAPATAAASTTIGRPNPSDAATNYLGCTPSRCLGWQETAPSTPSGHVWTSPIDGVVVQWTARFSSSSPADVRLRVLHPDPANAGDYIVAASSGFATVSADGVKTADVRVPIKAGDHFALDLPPTALSIGYVTTTGGTAKFFSPEPADGGSFTPLAVGDTNKELLLNAVVEPDVDGDGYGDESQDACPTDPEAHVAPCGFHLGPYDLTVASSSTAGCTASSTCMFWQDTPPAAGGHLATAPTDGVIVRWRGRFAGAGSDSAEVRLRRLEPVASTVAGRGTSEPFTVVHSPDVQHFPTRFPIYAGQQLGIDMPQNASASLPALNKVTASGATVQRASPQFLDQGSPLTTVTLTNTELLLNADVEPDVDGDGYGDTTQDACMTDPGPEPCDAVATIGAPDINRYSGLSVGCGSPAGPGACTFWEDPGAPGRRWAAPFNGVIVRWRVRFGLASNAVRLRVLQPGSPTAVVSSDYATTAATSAPQTFGSRVPVKAGDLIGLDLPDNGAAGGLSVVNAAGGTLKELRPAAADGSGFGPPTLTLAGKEALFNADVEPDADRDGFGDVSQDACPGTAGAIGGCPPRPPVTDVSGPKVGISHRTVTMTRGGVVAVRLSCPKSEPAGCTDGLLVLATAGKVSFARKKKISLGRKRFAIASGKSRVVKVKLSKRNRRGVIAKKRLSVRATASAVDQAGNRLATSATFKLKAPRPKR
jgi:hypothetical protein